MTGPIATTTAGVAAPIDSAQPVAADPLANTTASTVRSRSASSASGSAHDGPVGVDRLDRMARRGETVGEHATSPVGLGDEHAGGRRRELGEQSLGLRQRRHEVDGPAGGIRQCRRGGRPDRGEAQRRMRRGGCVPPARRR